MQSLNTVLQQRDNLTGSLKQPVQGNETTMHPYWQTSTRTAPYIASAYRAGVGRLHDVWLSAWSHWFDSTPDAEQRFAPNIDHARRRSTGVHHSPTRKGNQRTLVTARQTWGCG